MSIYLGNLSYEISEQELMDLLAEYGTVKSIYLPTDRETGRKRGFGFVEMSTEAEEASAIEQLNGVELMGRSLKVNQARERGSRGARSRIDKSSRF